MYANYNEVVTAAMVLDDQWLTINKKYSDNAVEAAEAPLYVTIIFLTWTTIIMQYLHVLHEKYPPIIHNRRIIVAHEIILL